MKVLVVGATGFVGKQVVVQLLAESPSHEVVAMGRDMSKLTELQELNQQRVTVLCGDVNDVESLERAMQGVQGVINCAGMYRWWGNSKEFRDVNHLGARAVGLAALKAGVKKVVHVSTVLAYGMPPGYGSEDRPIQPDTPRGPAASQYARSKAAGDAAVLELHRHQGLPACIVHLACVVGADPKLVQPREDVMRIMALVKGQVAATLGHDTVYTYIDVRDAANAIVKALSAGVVGRCYLVGNQRLTTQQYYRTISRHSGMPPPTARVPVWVAMAWSYFAAAWCSVLPWDTPTAPPDLIRTVASGSLLFDSSLADKELGLVYRNIDDSFRDAVQLIKERQE